MTIDQVATLINAGGVVVLLVAALYGGFTGWWIYGRVHETIVAYLTADRDRWRDLALGAVPLATKAVAAAEVAVKKNGTL